MTAIERASELYRRNLPNRDFTEHLGLYLRHAYVINFPDLFAMFRPVQAAAPIELIVDPAHDFRLYDSWFVMMAVGRVQDLVRLSPFELPQICFCRKWRNNLKVYRWSQFIRRCC